MKPFHTAENLIARLPQVRGRYNANVLLSKYTWFRVGGMAEVVFKPADLDDLMHFLAHKPDDVPLTVIGVGSNLLVRDGGVPGVTLRLGGMFGAVEVDGEVLRAGAGALDSTVAEVAAQHGLEGFEFLIGVPGTIGGALRMNAGAYTQETKDIMLTADALDPKGNLHTLELGAMGFTYRHAAIPDDWIFVGATFKGTKGDSDTIYARMENIKNQRQSTQPVKTRTGGSTFTNPKGYKAWELIDAAGCRGLTLGGAMVSDLHCNFLMNVGEATAADIENLGEEVRARVQKHSGVDLVWEIKRIGLKD